MEYYFFYIYKCVVEHECFNFFVDTLSPAISIKKSITDFNSISQYGFRYIYTPASNSPNGAFNGWYSLYLGLGSEYNNNFGFINEIL
jgi:hypothetical protein